MRLNGSNLFELTSSQEELSYSSAFQTELCTYRRDRVIAPNNEARIIVK
jgi:hypothetical protein